MSEKLAGGSEHIQETAEQQPTLRRPETRPAPESEKKSVDSLEAIQRKIEHTAKSRQEMKSHTDETVVSHNHSYITRQDKRQALIQTLDNVQKQMPMLERTFSKIVHSRAVFDVSEVSAKTVARPYGLLGGGLCAFVGTTILLAFSKKYGFRYSFSAILALFVVGFAAGVILEILFKLIFIKRRRARSRI